MYRILFTILSIAFFYGQNTALHAQDKHQTISGHITDASSGEDLIGATIYIKDLKTGTATNAYGFYSLSIAPGNHTLVVSYIGYISKEIPIKLSKNESINIKLDPEAQQLEEVVVSAERRNANVSRIEMSVEKVSMKTIKRIPALMGEVDIIKAIQLLPGVQATSEGSSGFSVRGGSPDQNLILLDEATVYNASHLMGFFSVFNNDAIKDVKLYKGDIPATFGGRLSSLLDIRSKDGNNQRLSGSGGVGTISSRLTLEGPLFTDKATFLVSGRRTYADLFLLLSSDEQLRKSRLFFYDMNGKINYRINNKNRIFAAAYMGRDKFANNFAGMDFGNQTFTLRWNHLFSPRLFSNFTLIGSFYDYYLKSNLSDQIAVDWTSKMQDYGFKADFSYNLNTNNSIRFGYHLTYHNFVPGEGGGIGASIVPQTIFDNEHAVEHALFAASQTTIGDRLTIKYGLRYTLFQNISNGNQVYFLNNYEVVDSSTYNSGTVFNHHQRLEPRAGFVYELNNLHSVKGSYSRTVQFVQLASNSTSGSPLDVWFPSSQNIKPQECDQFALGYFRNFKDNMFETSVEFYYKNMSHVVDFKDHAQLFGNPQLEQELRYGKGRAYGIELMVRKNEGKLNGWVSYTYSKATRKVDQVNKNDWYRSPYDKPNNISVVLNYELSKQWVVSANWVYASGTPVTYPTGRFEIEGRYVPIYSGRNEYRYPAYHRLDLSATWAFKGKPGKRYKSELNFSLYNAYGKKNPWTIMFRQEKDIPDQSFAEMVYLFSFVPSVTYNFSF